MPIALKQKGWSRRGIITEQEARMADQYLPAKHLKVLRDIVGRIEEQIEGSSPLSPSYTHLWYKLDSFIETAARIRSMQDAALSNDDRHAALKGASRELIPS